MAAQSGLGFSGIVAIQIPDDGAAGEVLTKITPDDYDYDWVAGGGGGGQVDSVVGGVNISVNAADPVNPIVDLDAAITGVSVNGVTLSAVGAVTNFLNETGVYSVPPGGSVLTLSAPAGLFTLTQSSGTSPLTVDLVPILDVLYLRLDTANDPLTGDLSTLSVTPTLDQDAGRTYGADSLRPLSVHGRLGVFVGSSAATGQGLPVNANGVRTFGQNPTGLMAGNQAEGSTGVASHYLRGGAFKGVACIGNAAAGSTGDATLRNNSGGSSLFGSAYTYGAGSARVEATAFGNFTTAYAYCTGNNHTFLNSGGGAFLAGYSRGGGVVNATASGAGAFCVTRPDSGANGGTATATAQGAGSFVQGSLQSTGLGASNVSILATGAGGFAQGRVRQTGAGLALISAAGDGAFAQGIAFNTATISASADGAFAQGNASAANITASGLGAFAHGSTTGAVAIVASAANSAQFGPGTNALADSLQVGAAGLRFKGTVGAPAAPQNGDFWIAGVYVYVRSNGVNIQIAGPGPLTN